MTASASLFVTACLGAALLGGCALGGGQASRDGAAYLFDKDVYVFDTQDPDRERQCYVASDGYFEMLRADGSVVVHHDFADRPVCEREEITLEADGDLVWSE